VFDEDLDIPMDLAEAPVPLESEIYKFMPPSIVGKEIEYLVNIFSTWKAVVENPTNLIEPYFQFLAYMLTNPIQNPVPSLTVDFVLHAHLLNPKDFLKVMKIMPNFEHNLNLGNDD